MFYRNDFVNQKEKTKPQIVIKQLVGMLVFCPLLQPLALLPFNRTKGTLSISRNETMLNVY